MDDECEAHCFHLTYVWNEDASEGEHVDECCVCGALDWSDLI